MERKYLVACVAIIATFATFSSGFRSLQKLSSQHGQYCPTVARWFAELKSHLHPADAEEAQLLAEMNLPPLPEQAEVSAHAIAQSRAEGQRARETAIREAERARRDAIRMHEDIAREARVSVAPVVVDLRGLDDLDQRIQISGLDRLDQRIQARTAAIARRIAVQNVRLQVDAAKLQAVSARMQSAARRRSPCGGGREVQ